MKGRRQPNADHPAPERQGVAAYILFRDSASDGDGGRRSTPSHARSSDRPSFSSAALCPPSATRPLPYTFHPTCRLYLGVCPIVTLCLLAMNKTLPTPVSYNSLAVYDDPIKMGLSNHRNPHFLCRKKCRRTPNTPPNHTPCPTATHLVPVTYHGVGGVLNILVLHSFYCGVVVIDRPSGIRGRISGDFICTARSHGKKTRRGREGSRPDARGCQWGYFRGPEGTRRRAP